MLPDAQGSSEGQQVGCQGGEASDRISDSGKRKHEANRQRKNWPCVQQSSLGSQGWIAQLAGAPAAKADSLSSFQGPRWWKARTDDHILSSELHICTMIQASHRYTKTIKCKKSDRKELRKWLSDTASSSMCKGQSPAPLPNRNRRSNKSHVCLQSPMDRSMLSQQSFRIVGDGKGQTSN